ncbi:NAD(P)H-quinone oxidoreductase subunit U, chloroplastic [Macadamia integrifolia]|uniref:NAD(P)H-quinone oxidoreductase subunit U, chloroplastic n=1 Tax=Macadamia integrifolia TaxID=60698 RepID=UPI001C4FC78C|nr:NAD(P)H-quinone oxidoreductase subunit U, chloroplastic [Macadamia integrifolia]
MAVYSTTATPYITWRDPNGFQYSTPKLGFLLPHSVRFPVKQQQRNYMTMKSSGDGSQETATETETETETKTETELESESQSSVEATKSPPSIISALNVEKALRGIAITEVDHYGRLGLQRGCPYKEVTVAYKNKYEELMNQGPDEEDFTKKLDLLKESYSILSSEQERRLYDWSLARAEKPDKYLWPFEVDITKSTSPETPPPQEPEDVGPTRVVGYFILGSLVLSYALSIALNR